MLTAADLEARTHRRGARLDLSCPHSRFRGQYRVGHSREVMRTVTPSEGKDFDGSKKKQLLFLYFDLFCRFFWIFFFYFLSPPLM